MRNRIWRESGRIGSFLLISLCAISLAASAASAACPTGKSSVTIVNPAGKVIDICVPDSAIGHIGGPTDVVIAAACPCFSQETVATLLASQPTYQCYTNPGATDRSGGACTVVECYDGPSWLLDIYTQTGPVRTLDTGACRFPEPPWCPPGISCQAYMPPAENNVCSVDSANGSTQSYITEAEAEACVAILKTFVR